MIAVEYKQILSAWKERMEMTMDDQKDVLLAGYGRADITPDWEVSICGYQDDDRRKTTMVLDPVYVTCVAVRSGENTALLYTVDATGIYEEQYDAIRRMVQEATGVPGDYVYFSATHTHSSPTMDEKAETLFYAGAVRAAQDALADLAPAKMLRAVKEIPGLNFVRHYLMEDGTYFGSCFGNGKQKFIAHATEGDPRMVLIRFDRGVKKDILMMNWQAHNDNAVEVGYHNISASYTGRIRAYLEQDTGAHFAYFCGAGGNQNPDSMLPEEKHKLNWLQYARKLSDYALEMMADMKPVKGTQIKGVRLQYDICVNHDWDHMEKIAREVMDVWYKQDINAADRLAKSLGLSSVFHANILLIRLKQPKTCPIELNAFCIGDMGFITGSFEMFSNTGLYVRANAPFDTTFILTGNCNYMPPVEAYDYRAYEADTSLFARGTMEKVCQVYVDLLNKLK